MPKHNRYVPCWCPWCDIDNLSLLSFGMTVLCCAVNRSGHFFAVSPPRLLPGGERTSFFQLAFNSKSPLMCGMASAKVFCVALLTSVMNGKRIASMDFGRRCTIFFCVYLAGSRDSSTVAGIFWCIITHWSRLELILSKRTRHFSFLLLQIIFQFTGRSGYLLPFCLQQNEWLLSRLSLLSIVDRSWGYVP